MRRSKITSANRVTGGSGGKALATHAMGRRNTLQMYDNILNDLDDEEDEVTIPQIVEKTKKNKKDGWISSKAASLWVRNSIFFLLNCYL